MSSLIGIEIKSKQCAVRVRSTISIGDKDLEMLNENVEGVTDYLPVERPRSEL